MDLRRILQDERMKPYGIALASFLLFVCLMFISIFWWPNIFSSPSERVIFVSRGASFSSVIDSLHAQGIIGSKWRIKLAGRILGWTKEMKVGKYHFSSWTSNFSILRDLKDGTSRRLIPVSIPEGLRMRTIAKKFAAEVGIDETEFLTLCSDTSLIHQFDLPGNTLEGYLLPDTYYFHWQTDAGEIVGQLVAAFKRFYTDSLARRASEMKLSMNGVVTLASIVEGEAQREDERTVIAGVYHNRLKKRMRLEADPTVQYLLPDGPRRLFYEDLRVNSPYNTYLHYGLPPGPINNPGRQAILAALYPANHQFLFFVADGKGGHQFSKTYSDHQRAVRLYRRARRDMQRAANLGG